MLNLSLLNPSQIKNVTVVYRARSDSAFKFGWGADKKPHVWRAENEYAFRTSLDDPDCT